MKKILFVLTAIAFAFVLASCGNDTPYIPSMEEEVTDKVYTPEDAAALDPIKDYTEYHRLKGYYIFETRYDLRQVTGMEWVNKEYNDYYDYSTYEGHYNHLVDAVYATTLQIRSNILEGYSTQPQGRLLLALQEFLTDKNVTALHPKVIVHGVNGKVNKYYVDNEAWIYRLQCLYEKDKQRFLADEDVLLLCKAYIVLSSWVSNRAVNDADAFRELKEKMPGVLELIWTEDVELIADGIDSATGYRYIEFSSPDGLDILVSSGTSKNLPRGFEYQEFGPEGDKKLLPSGRYVRLKSGERYYLTPSFDGWVMASAITEEGLLTVSTIIDVESLVHLFPEKKVELKSKYLEKAVRDYLGKSEADSITTSELAVITHVYINGDSIFLGTNAPDGTFLSMNTKQKNSDFNLADLDWFYGLYDLYVKNLNLPTLPDGGYLRARSLTVTYCELENIDAVRNSVAESIDFSHNKLTDASVFKNVIYVWDIYLNDNAELNILKLPHKHIRVIDRRNTKLSESDFLEDGVIVDMVK